MWTYTDTTELHHHGIKGMRWGVRRYRNPDGSLTPKGKARYNKAADRKADKKRKKEMRQDVKRRRLLTDDELKSRIARIELEKKLRTLTDEEINQGRVATKEVLSNSGKKVATTVVSGATLYGVKAAMTKSFDAREAAGYVAPKPKNK